MSSTHTGYDITGAQKGGVTNPMMHGATESSGDLTPEHRADTGNILSPGEKRIILHPVIR